MIKSLRKQDQEVEQAVAKFLDSHFYPNNDFSEFKRFTMRADQMKGKDVQFTWKDLHKIIVDEKAQAHYINKDMKTFAFEIDFYTKSGELVGGWFLDPEKATEYYLLIYIWADEDKNIGVHDIQKLECILIKREAIIVYLYSIGLPPEKIRSIGAKVRSDGINGPVMKGVYPDCHFHFNTKLAEKPVNLVIYKSLLKELASGRFLVESNHFKDLTNSSQA